jgi:parvulin-like peptidyl-prolyl isomerase
MNKVMVIILSVVLMSSCSYIQEQTQSQGGQSSPQTIYDLSKVNEGPMVVKVGSTTIHQGLLDLLSTLNPRIKAQLSNPMTRKKIINSLVEQQLLYQEAIKQGLNTAEDVVVKSLLNKHVIISNSLLEKEVEKAMNTSYEERKEAQFTKKKVSLIATYFVPQTSRKNKKKEVKPTDKQIKAALDKITKIKAELDKGGNFEKIAKEKSDDKMTAKKGGVAGKISKDDKRFIRLGYKDLIDAAFKMNKDDVSDPIKIANGYYIIKVTSDSFTVPFEDAKRVLGFELQNKVKEALINKLKTNAKIEYAATFNPANLPTAKPKEKVKGHGPDDGHGHGKTDKMKALSDTIKKESETKKPVTEKKELKK